MLPVFKTFFPDVLVSVSAWGLSLPTDSNELVKPVT